MGYLPFFDGRSAAAYKCGFALAMELIHSDFTSKINDISQWQDQRLNTPDTQVGLQRTASASLMAHFVDVPDRCRVRSMSTQDITKHTVLSFEAL